MGSAPHRKRAARASGPQAPPALGGLVQAGSFRTFTTGLALVFVILAGLLSSCATAPAFREGKAA